LGEKNVYEKIRKIKYQELTQIGGDLGEVTAKCNMGF
jgi:hypothetical protein